MKVKINNEEVLCDKNITINEEMLNTSSVILNNVYPKTWEEDKDYVSRFYYPKDYSKCKIYDEIEHPATREDVEGTNFTINADTIKRYQVQTLKGQTTQSSTPTPSSPITGIETTGRQVVSVCGKNLYNPSYRTPSDTFYFMNCTGSEENGEFTLTATGTDMYMWQVGVSGNYYNQNTNGELFDFIEDTYVISITNTNIKSNIITFFDEDKKSLGYIGFGGDGYRKILRRSDSNVPDNARYFTIRIGLNPATTGTTYKFKVQVEKGDTYTDYEKFKGNDYEVNLGKNLLKIDSGSFNTRTIDNMTITNNGDGSFTLNGSNPNTAFSMQISYRMPILESGTYTYTPNVSGTLSGGGISSIIYGLNENTPTALISKQDLTPTTFRTTENYNVYYMWLYFATGRTCENYTYKPQLEKGDNSTSYSPYKTPIELCKIGNYQDYIFRNTTENPLYDSNLEEGQWYIHKEIGRYTFTGTENWQYTSATKRFSNVFSNINLITPTDTGRHIEYIKSNYFYNSTSDVDGGMFQYQNQIIVHNYNYTSASDFKTWLSSNNVEVYYVLNTPTNTLIEDEELINQLNSIRLLYGLNNVSITSPNLPFIMSLMYNYREAYTEEDLYFSGVVENTGNISLNPRHPHYCNLQVLDFKTFLSEGETLDFVIYNKTVLEAINQVIGTISDYGFVLGNVNILHGDDVIGAYSTKDKTAYDVFNYLADITQSRWTTRVLDENIVAIDFYDPSLMPQGTSIEYTQNWFTNHKIQDMSFSYSSRDYRNKQVMLSGEVYANVETTEIIVADGYQTQFNTTDKIGYVSSMLVNGSPVQVITKEEYELGYEGDFIYQPGNPYFESTDLISTGAIITIVYYAIIEGREILLNQEEISRIGEMIARKGVIARYENRNDATTTGELQAIGQSYLKFKGSPEVILKVDSLENIWNVGERVEFNSPLEELTTEYMVKKKTTQYIPTQDNVFYTYELSSSFNSETEINYFDNQRSKMMGNIGVGEVVSRNIDIENTATIEFYNLEVEEVEITNNNTLQSELQGVLGGGE